LIVAAKSPRVAFGLASVKVATIAPLIGAPSVPVTFTLVGVSGASVTVAVLFAVTVLPPTSLILALTA